MRKGFTLLELIIVVIIVGVLATLGFMQYANVIERSRRAEARANLGVLRQLEMAYHEDPSSLGPWAEVTAGADGDQLNSGLPAVAENSSDCAAATNHAQHFFGYYCASGSGTCSAYRCTGGGKNPNPTVSYTVSLTTDGTFTGPQ